MVALAQSVDELTEMMQMFATSVDKRFERIESTMATKTYVDYKLSDLKGDMLVGFKQSDSKMNLVAQILNTKGIFSRNESAQVQALGPFAA